MYKVSELISTPVISIYESSYQGIIYNILFDLKAKKCKNICVLDENNSIQKSLKYSEIYQISNECIFIKNESQIEPDCNSDIEDKKYINPLNVKIFDLSGKFIGKCIDIELDSKFNIVSIFSSSGKIIKSVEIFNWSKSAIIIHDKVQSLSKFKPTTKILPTTTHNNKVLILEQQSTTSQQIENKEKIITDFKFLIGRKLKKDIVSINGEIIAKNGNTITKDIVNKASFYGKLVELTRHSI